MNYPELKPILERLVTKYRDVRFSEWEELARNGEMRHDYSEDEESPTFFWQAHTDVLEIDKNDHGHYANVSISVYPENVHSVPPAPAAGMLVYKSGVCDIGTPWDDYLYDQETKTKKNAT